MRAATKAMVGAMAAAAIALLIAPAWGATPEDVANDISKQVMSPFCPGVTLHDCPSQAAIDLRQEIEQWVRDGSTRPQILERLEREFGAGVRASPSVGGSGLGAWVVPALGAIVGAIVAAELARRWTHRAGRHYDQHPAPQVTPSERRRLELELRAFRGRS